MGRQFHGTQVPATFSVCSNVPEHTEAVHVRTYTNHQQLVDPSMDRGDPQQLVDRLIAEVLKHQEARKKILTEKYQPYLDTLDSMERELKSKLGIKEEEPEEAEAESEEETRGKRKAQSSSNKTNNKRRKTDFLDNEVE